MIVLGPAGTGMGTVQGLHFVKSLGLGALEIEFTHGVRMQSRAALQIGEENRKTAVQLSVHAPYFVNLAARDALTRSASIARIIASCERAHQMGAQNVVFHPGYYMGRPRAQVFEMVSQAVQEMHDEVRKRGFGVRLAPETTGRAGQFGTLEELLRLRDETGCFLCVDFAHIYARSMGKVSWKDVISQVSGIKGIHSHCSGISYGKKGEIRHENLTEEFFTPLARRIIDAEISITIISESPRTWKDSLMMEEIFRRLS